MQAINQKLKNLIPLNHKICIYVPSTQGVSTEADTSQHIEATAELLSNCFGGATSTQAIGYWVSDSDGLVKEHPVLVYAYANEADYKQNIDLIIDYCYKLKQELDQEAISLELDNVLYLI